jgi:hypothetical protein
MQHFIALFVWSIIPAAIAYKLYRDRQAREGTNGKTRTRDWSATDQRELLIFAGLGAIAGVVAGFALSGSGMGLFYWLTAIDGNWLWPALGAGAGGATKYLIK